MLHIDYSQGLMEDESIQESPTKDPDSPKFGAALTRLMVRKGWGPNDLGEAAGIDRTLVSRHLNGHVFPRPRARREYARAFNMEPVDFEAEWRKFNIPLTPGGPGIPVVNRSPAGDIMDYHEWGEHSGMGHYYIDRGTVEEEAAFAVIVTGNSMVGEMNDGDEAIFAPLRTDGKLLNSDSDPLALGEVVHARFTEAFRKNGCTIAIYERTDDGKVLLKKANSDYKSILCETSDIQQLSVLIQVRQNRRKRRLKRLDEYTEATRNDPAKSNAVASRGEESQITNHEN